MRKSIKNVIAMFLFVLFVLSLSPVIFAEVSIPSATPDFYVNDFAEVFSEDEKDRLMDNATSLADSHDGIQVVITTIKSLGGNTIEEYSLEMYNSYAIGKDDMGVLILLSTEDRQVRIEVGLAMEAYINDSKIGRLIDNYAIPSFKEDKFNEGLIKLQEAFISEIVTSIEAEEDSSEDNALVTSTDSTNDTGSGVSSVFGSVFKVLVFLALIVFVLCSIAFIVYKIIDRFHQKYIEVLNLRSELAELKYQLSNNNESYKNKIASLYCELSRYKIESQKRLTALKDEAEKKYAEYLSSINNLERENLILKDKYGKLKESHSTLSDRYARAKKATSEILSIISSISVGNANNLLVLKEAKSIY